MSTHEMSLLWVFAFLVPERLLELALSRRNLRLAIQRGGREFAPETYPRMVALHSLFLTALFVESGLRDSGLRQVPMNSLTLGCIPLLVLLQAFRYWCMATLGAHWNTRIVVVPGLTAKLGGPYRFVRHPNYLAVVLEFLLLPLLMRAPASFAVFFPLNLLILRQRIRLEEEALRRFTNYDAIFSRDKKWARQPIQGG